MNEPFAPTFHDWSSAASAIGDDLAARAAKHDADGTFVADGYARLKADGFFSALVPAELGGGGAGVGEMMRAIRVLGAGCGSAALAFSMHSHVVAVNAWRWRHQQAPTDGMLKRVAAENLIMVSSGGSDWLASAGTATKVDGGFRINARKGFASGSPVGDLLATSVVYDDPEAGPTVLHFPISLKAEGISINCNWDVMGMRGTGSQEVVIKDVFLPDALVLGRRPQGQWHMLFHIISMIAMPMILAAYVGIAEGARAKALALATRKGEDDITLALVGELENHFAATDMAFERLLDLADNGAPGPSNTNRVMIAKTLATQSAIATVDKAMEIAGGASFYRKLGLERAFRDIQAARFHPLQEKPQQRFAARLALGLDIDG